MSNSSIFLLVGVGILLAGIFPDVDSKLIKVKTSEELQSALDKAESGDKIQMLRDVTYSGDFVISNSVSATLLGDTNTTIRSKKMGVHLEKDVSAWTLRSFSIKSDSGEGILVEGSKNTVDGLVIQIKTGKAILVKGESNTIENCVVNDADDGIVLEGTKTSLTGNVINVDNAISISKNTCCGRMDDNVANGKVKIDGSEYKVSGNVINGGLNVKGCKNQFKNNVVNDGTSFPKKKSCEAIDRGGNVYND